MKITGVILVAGTSTRMGRNKLLLPYKGHTIIEEVLHQISKVDLHEVLVITGHERDRVERLIAEKHINGVKCVYNSNFKLGRAESIKCAVRNLEGASNAVLFMVADKPTVMADLINRVVDKFKECKPAILYVKTPGGRGHPIIFSERLFDDLMALDGDLIGHGLIAEYYDDVMELEDDKNQVELDTMDNYRSLIGRLE